LGLDEAVSGAPYDHPVSVRVVPTPYGRAAAEALRVEIAHAKRTSPLAPVAVVVPGNSAGVAVRRLLASGELGPISGAGSGLIGITFLTTYRLAELLAAPRLAAQGRRPVSTPVVGAAVRRVLATDPGPMFGRVATHPATEEALVGAHRELSDLDDTALRVLAQQSLRAHEVVRIHRLVKARLESAWYDEHDLMRAAHEIVEADSPLLRELGTVVCHLPQRVSTPSARLLRAVAARNDLVVIAGLSGVTKADAVVAASVERLGGAINVEGAAVEPAHGTAVCTSSDADDEVRVVVRGIVDAMRDGVPLERMAVVFGNNEPYARLLHDHLELAGIAHNGVSVRTLADSVLGRALSRMLALPDDDYRRDDVFSLLAGVPVLDGHAHPVPAVAWERVSRDAGVVGGVAEWGARLGHYAARLPAADPDGEGSSASDRRRAWARDLQRFVEELAADLERAPSTWLELSKWVHRLITRWVGGDDRRANWSLFEQEAARRVELAVDRLGGLDPVEANPTLEVFRRSLALELETARDRVGRLGEGVFVGSAGLALGVEFDRMWVCGLAEGVFPAPPRDDPLIADADRGALGGELARRADRVADDQRSLLAALASTTGPRVMCFPRGDLRRSTDHVPSRFLLDTIEALSGARPIGAQIPDAPWCTAVPSFVHGLTHASFPATRHELDVRAALAGDPRIAAVPDIARGLELVRARRSAAFTRFDGNLTHLGPRLAVRSPAAPDATVSATRLEAWAKCPHAFFVRALLHVQPIERPEEIVQISPIDRGNVVHEALERFLRELIGVAGVGRPWSGEHRARLHAILDEGFAGVEARGAAGRRLLWDRSCRQLHSQLDLFLDFDGDYRIERHADTIATELEFGRNGSEHPAIEIKCSDGRTVRMSGSIDRVDRFADGRLAVIDYKSGSPTPYAKMSLDDPLLKGQLLQLPIYAHAARTLLGDPSGEPIKASYWFVLRDPKNERGYPVDARIEGALDHALGIIVDGIERGVFVAKPPEPGWSMWIECPYCEPDGLGTTDTHRAWLRKQGAPELADYLELAGIEASNA
jgi:ATP-dependent helicase/nuclease subunit B